MAVDFGKFDVDNERARLRKMSDEELIREGQAARFLCAPNQNFGKPPREQFVIAPRLCKEEWRQRVAANTHAGQVDIVTESLPPASIWSDGCAGAEFGILSVT